MGRNQHPFCAFLGPPQPGGLLHIRAARRGKEDRYGQEVHALTLFLLLGLGPNAARGDLTDGLVALWKFEGNFNDSAGTNHGTPKGGARIVADAARGQVLALDGTGDYVEVPNSPSLNIAGNQISMAAWVNLNSVATVQIIVCKVFSGTTRVSPYFSYSLHALANGQPRVWISRTGGAANQAGAGGMLTAGTWHHVATVYDGTQLKLYFDSALAGAGNVTGNLIGYDTVVRLGVNGALTELLDGRLDDVRLYHRALSEMEVRYLVGDR
jgi:hypothetical protein